MFLCPCSLSTLVASSDPNQENKHNRLQVHVFRGELVALKNLGRPCKFEASFEPKILDPVACAKTGHFRFKCVEINVFSIDCITTDFVELRTKTRREARRSHIVRKGLDDMGSMTLRCLLNAKSHSSSRLAELKDRSPCSYSISKC